MPKLSGRGSKKDDTLVRNFAIKLYKDLWNIEMSGTPQEKNLIDLKEIKNGKLGCELEHGGWKGCFWEDEYYSNISGLGFQTVNVPIRKEKHFLPSYIFYRKLFDNSQSYLINQFIRTNKDFTQFIMIESDVFRDPTKKIYSRFKPKNSDSLEDWMSFKREHVKTYNLIDGKWILNNYEI